MSLASLEAFLERAHSDQRLQELLCVAPDAAAVAAIAQAAGYPVSELDLWQASATSPADLLPDPNDLLIDSVNRQFTPENVRPTVEEARPTAEGPRNRKDSPIPDPWLEDDPLSSFLHQAQGDEALQEALATAPDAAAVAAIAQAAGYPISELDLWRASAASPEELIDPMVTVDTPMDTPVQAPEPQDFMAEASMARRTPWSIPNDEALLGFLHQAQGDENLQLALATAPDAAAVAAIAQAAGYPISELDLWRASGIPAEELFPPEPDLSALDAPLARFLLEAEHDPTLQEALAGAEDAAAVAAIAQAAGYPITAADLWEASDALPEELLLTELVIVEVEDDLPN